MASFGMWGAAWVRRKNEGKRRGRLPDTYVNESECTDLKIGQEFGSRKNSYKSTGDASTKYERNSLSGEKGKNM